MKRCKHPHSQACTYLVQHRHCTACHEVVSLGPATMTPEVDIEVRAATIAEFEEAGRTEESALQPRDGWQFGWWLHLDEERGPDPCPERLPDGTLYNAAYLAFHPGWPAGWLARQIVEHEEP